MSCLGLYLLWSILRDTIVNTNLSLMTRCNKMSGDMHIYFFKADAWLQDSEIRLNVYSENLSEIVCHAYEVRWILEGTMKGKTSSE